MKRVRTISKEKKKQLREHFKEKQKGKCFYCKRPFKELRKLPTIDHRVPVASGGTDEIENLCLSCSYCNNLKSNYSEKDFKKVVKAILKGKLTDEKQAKNYLKYLMSKRHYLEERKYWKRAVDN